MQKRKNHHHLIEPHYMLLKTFDWESPRHVPLFDSELGIQIRPNFGDLTQISFPNLNYQTVRDLQIHSLDCRSCVLCVSSF